MMLLLRSHLELDKALGLNEFGLFSSLALVQVFIPVSYLAGSMPMEPYSNLDRRSLRSYAYTCRHVSAYILLMVDVSDCLLPQYFFEDIYVHKHNVLYVYTYACTHVSMHACMHAYVCMYVCMQPCNHVCM